MKTYLVEWLIGTAVICAKTDTEMVRLTNDRIGDPTHAFRILELRTGDTIDIQEDGSAKLYDEVTHKRKWFVFDKNLKRKYLYKNLKPAVETR